MAYFLVWTGDRGPDAHDAYADVYERDSREDAAIAWDGERSGAAPSVVYVARVDTDSAVKVRVEREMRATAVRVT